MFINSKIYRSPAAVILYFWFAFIVWRVFQLGFHHDDWALLTVTSAYGEHLMEGGRTRPLNVALGYLGVRVFGANAWAWHIYGAFLLLINALVMYGFCRALSLKIEANYPVNGLATGVAVAWMLFPWNLGYTAWPVMFPGLVATALFMGALWLLVQNPASFSSVRKSCYCLVLSSLIYEAFWFAVIPMSMMVWGLVGIKQFRIALRAFGALAATQLALVIWNLTLSHWGSGGGKQLSAEWLALLLASFTIPIKLALLFFAAVAIKAVASGRDNASFRIALLLGASAVGMLISMGLYALAGYSLVSRGLSSRTYIAVDIWIATGFTVCAACFARTLSRHNAITTLCTVTLLLGLGAKNLRETHKWAVSWKFHQGLLASLPLPELLKTKPDSVVMFSRSTQSGEIDNLTAFWDTTSAVYVTQPALRPAIQQGLQFAVGRHQEMLTTWDGHAVAQSWCSRPQTRLWSVPTGAVYLINQNNQLELAPTPWMQPC
ncbi:MAG: hypothetical protein Q7T87_20545 [Polaromonas sp.]|nr:hypothetical protein [Polaromonas sp.]